MENFVPHGREIFWYNIGVPQARSDLIFDIGSRILQRRSCKIWRTFGLAHSCADQNPGSAASTKPPSTVGRSPRDRRSLLGAAETHPTPAAYTLHQRIGFRGKAANFTQRKTEYDGASRGNHAAYPLFLFFVKVLSGTCHETGFRGCAAFPFRAEAAALGQVGAGRSE